MIILLFAVVAFCCVWMAYLGFTFRGGVFFVFGALGSSLICDEFSKHVRDESIIKRFSSWKWSGPFLWPITLALLIAANVYLDFWQPSGSQHKVRYGPLGNFISFRRSDSRLYVQFNADTTVNVVVGRGLFGAMWLKRIEPAPTIETEVER